MKGLLMGGQPILRLLVFHRAGLFWINPNTPVIDLQTVTLLEIYYSHLSGEVSSCSGSHDASSDAASVIFIVSSLKAAMIFLKSGIRIFPPSCFMTHLRLSPTNVPCRVLSMFSSGTL